MGRLSRQSLLLVIVTIVVALAVEVIPRIGGTFDRTPPVIDVWYGSHQVFGRSGLPQRWVNVLGNAVDRESKVVELRYRLNDGILTRTRLGPDPRRLATPGDFNIEIDPADLQPGENRLSVEAVNGNGESTTTVVIVTFEHHVIPPSMQIDWSRVTNLQDVLQVVDGKWRWDTNGVRPVELGYDRMLNVGDASWTNYQVEVPVTVYGIDQSAFSREKSGRHAGVSIDLRWVGHSDVPEVCPPPHCGWDPVGDFNKYWFKKDGADFLGLKVKEKEDEFPTHPYHFEIGHTYVFAASVTTTPLGNLYRMKVWEPAVESEPAEWLFERLAAPEDGSIENPPHGAFALVAHHSDVEFGNITVTPLP